jgi:hypothetical protein
MESIGRLHALAALPTEEEHVGSTGHDSMAVARCSLEVGGSVVVRIEMNAVIFRRVIQSQLLSNLLSSSYVIGVLLNTINPQSCQYYVCVKHDLSFREIKVTYKKETFRLTSDEVTRK